MKETNADVVVIGAGPGGLAAASEACRSGLSVIVLDEQVTPGGQIFRNIENAAPQITGVLGPDYIKGRDLAEEFRRSGARYESQATVWNIATDGVVDYIRLGQSHRATGKSLVVASGAMERPFPIRGWTLPGVMGAGAAQVILKSSGAVPRRPAVLVGCGPLLYLLAWQYLRAGVSIAALVDTTSLAAYTRASAHLFGALVGWRDLKKGLGLLWEIRRHKVPVYNGVTQLAVEGDKKATGLSFKHGAQKVQITADLILLHQGVVPNTQFSWSMGAKHFWNETQLCWQPVTDQYGQLDSLPIYFVGDNRAIVGAQASATQGRLAALAIAQKAGVTIGVERERMLTWLLRKQTAIRPFLDTLYTPLYENRVPPGNGTVVCRCEEVTSGQIREYVGLGCLGPNQTKAFGRCGMGPCQGRFCGLTVTEMIADTRKVQPQSVGYYRIRPPVKPVTLGELSAVASVAPQDDVTLEEDTV